MKVLETYKNDMEKKLPQLKVKHSLSDKKWMADKCMKNKITLYTNADEKCLVLKWIGKKLSANDNFMFLMLF